MRASCKLFAGALGSLAAGCQSGALSAGTQAVQHLSDVPRWTAAGPSNESCFGASVAVGDLDGDGNPDLVVADPPCLWHPAAPGRVAIYRGLAAGDFAPDPAVTMLDWQNPPRGGGGMTVATGDVDADGHADLLVRSGAGVQVFAGIADAGAPLPPPVFRAPGTGAFGPALLGDLDGDGRADLVTVKAGAATIWLAAPGAPPFAAARTIAGVTGLVRVDDTDADGRADVALTSAAGARLFRGCVLGAPDCDGGLGAAPAWETDRRVYGVVPDSSGDGRVEVLLGDGTFGPLGRVSLHLSDAATGGFADAAAAVTLGDPNYVGLGNAVARPGDLDGDGVAADFAVAAFGRIYAFFPAPGAPDLAPGFAWPREDAAQAQRIGGGTVLTTGAIALAGAGDLDGDGYADLVVGNAPELDDPAPGRVFVFGGGKRKKITPAHPRPYLHGARTCGAAPGALPDLTIDAEALARSLYVERRTFAPDACELVEGCVAGPGERRLLRFTTSIANLGGGAAVIPGPETAPYLYHLDECHGHHHLTDFARYELRDGAGGVIAVGRKQGFFLVDIAPYCADGAPGADYYPDQGISPGWSDVYVASIACQWLDITDIPDGDYTLRLEVDSFGLVEQDDVLPDTAAVRLQLQDDAVRALP